MAFKLRPIVITPNDLHTNILISSLLDSPLDSLYHSLQKVFAPILVKEGQLSQSVNPKIQDLITQLEVGLGSVMRQQRREDVAVSRGLSGQEILGILTVMDEYQFWVESVESSTKLHSKERAQFFQEQFQALAAQFDKIDSLPFEEVIDLVDITQDCLDEVWKQTEHDPPYPEQHMTHLLEIISGNFSRYVQRHLKDLDVWSGQFKLVYSSLQDSLRLCDKWSGVAEALTTKFWKQFSAHQWKGTAFVSESLSLMTLRIEEVCEIMYQSV